MSANRSSINALSNAEIENLFVEYPDIRCPCLIPDSNGVHQCTMMFKSKLGTSPLRLDQFMKHYVSKVHQRAALPNEVKKWFPQSCPTPGCRHRYTTTGKRLQDHIKQCSLTHNKAKTQQRQQNLEWEQIGNNATTRGRKPAQNAQPPARNIGTTTTDSEWEQTGNAAIIGSRKAKQNAQPPRSNVQSESSNDEQVELRPRQTLNKSPPRSPTTNWTLDKVQERKTGEAE